MADPKHGLVAAIEQIGPGAPEADVEQAALFDDFEADAPMLVAPIERSGKRGRPPGARNKSTEQWRQYLLSRYRSPLVGLMELYSRTPAELARELGLYAYHEGELMLDPATGRPVLATGEAFKAQLAAMIAALPYLHQRLPQAVEVTTPQRGTLVLNFGEASDQSDEATIVFAQREENQQVIDVTPSQSDDAMSNVARKLLEHNDE